MANPQLENTQVTRLDGGNAGQGIVTQETPDQFLFDFTDINVTILCQSINHRSNTAILTFTGPEGAILQNIKLCLTDFRQRDSLIRSLIDKQSALGEVVYWGDILKGIIGYLVEYEQKQRPARLTMGDILSTDISEVEWLCKDVLLRSGLSILAGKPKIGKSAQALRLAHAVATGGTFLERQCQQGKVAYFALEDNAKRLKIRATTIGITCDTPISFYLSIAPLPDGLAQFRELVTEDNYRLVVLDTMLAAMVPGIKENDAVFGQLIEQIHNLANEVDLSILAIHHFTKRPTGDLLTDLRGHSSAGASVDLVLGLYNAETPGHYTLKSVSRDSESLEVALSYAGDKLLWELDHNWNEVQKINNDSAMLQLLTDLGEVDIMAICNANGKSRPVNDAVLKRLMESGDVERTPKKVGYQTVYVYRNNS
jgi:hypothetical protein